MALGAQREHQRRGLRRQVGAKPPSPPAHARSSFFFLSRCTEIYGPVEPCEIVFAPHAGLSRFGRGIGLRFIRRLDEWLPGRQGRQEVIKVKVFEGQGLVFRGVVANSDHDYCRRRQRRRQGGSGRLTKKTKSGTVIVATITPDKLVRFWTSGGVAIGSLDQVWRAPDKKITSGNFSTVLADIRRYFGGRLL